MWYILGGIFIVFIIFLCLAIWAIETSPSPYHYIDYIPPKIRLQKWLSKQQPDNKVKSFMYQWLLRKIERRL